MSEIHTGRLLLRPVTAAHQAALHALFTQPGVRRFIFDDQIIDAARTGDIIRTSIESFEKQRFGLWLAQPMRGADCVGFGAFWHFREPPELELLYGVADQHRKQGYGREIAHAVVDYGFRVLGMTAIRASTDTAHAESRRLLEDLGFAMERRATVGGLDTVFYSRRAPGELQRHAEV